MSIKLHGSLSILSNNSTLRRYKILNYTILRETDFIQTEINIFLKKKKMFNAIINSYNNKTKQIYQNISSPITFNSQPKCLNILKTGH